jgi:hypothetical protein
MKTSRRIYTGIFLAFAVFIAALNFVTFLTGFDKKQMTNFFYLPERTVAAFLLTEHIVFESGLFLQEIEQNEMNRHIDTVCAEKGVDPKLVKMMLPSGTKSNYIIYTDGSIGIMRVKPYMFNSAEAVDPFSYQGNISIGVAYLSKLIRESYDIEEALEKYYAPASKTIFERDVARMNELSQEVNSAYETSGGKQRKQLNVWENAKLENQGNTINIVKTGSP